MQNIEQQVLNYLSLNPAGLKAQELQTLIRPRVSQPTLWRRLDDLQAQGRVRRIGRGRASRYLSQGSSHAISDLRSRALHVEIGRKLIRDPELIESARRRLQRLQQTIPYSQPYLDRWHELLSGSLEKILQVLGSEYEKSIALRHVSPFAGILSERERLEILRKQGLIR